jgi:hypothetical protein
VVSDAEALQRRLEEDCETTKSSTTPALQRRLEEECEQAKRSVTPEEKECEQEKS